MILRSNARLTRGFTLLELMVVIIILALLASIAAPQVTKYLRRAKGDTAKVQTRALAAAVDFYQIDMGRYPTTAEGMKALLVAPSPDAKWQGPYLKQVDSLTDPWGNPYQYAQPGTHGAVDIFSWGADGKAGGEGDDADIGNW